MFDGLPADERMRMIEQGKSHEVAEARQAQEAEGPWEDRGAIGLEHVEVVIDRVLNPHSMTDYPCRLPDGRMGRVAIREIDGEWVAVCVL